jgi:hypothetical protein
MEKYKVCTQFAGGLYGYTGNVSIPDRKTVVNKDGFSAATVGIRCNKLVDCPDGRFYTAPVVAREWNGAKKLTCITKGIATKEKRNTPFSLISS